MKIGGSDNVEKVLSDNDYKKVSSREDKSYFNSGSGFQIKIDYKKKLISLLSQAGKLISYSSTYSLHDIKSHADGSYNKDTQW